MPVDALYQLATIQPRCKTLHETVAHPGVTRLYDYIQRHQVRISLGEAKRITENCKICALWKPLFLRPPCSKLIQSSKAWGRLSIDIVGLKQNQYLLTGVDESGVCFLLLSRSRTSRLEASSNVFRPFLQSSEPHSGSFIPTGAHSSCHRN